MLIVSIDLESNKNTKTTNSKQTQNETTTNTKMVIVDDQKENKKDEKDNDVHDDDEWPIINTKICLTRVGRTRKKRKYDRVGDYPLEIYPDFYYSPELLSQRKNPEMF